MLTASVVIVSHNKRPYLEATLAALARQSMVPEVIVVDDASDPPLGHLPGATRTLQRGWSRHLQAARNEGIAAAAGDIVLLMDDDCLVREEYVSQHLWRHERDPGCLVVGSVKRVHYRGEPDFWNLPSALDVREWRTFDCHSEWVPDHGSPWNLAPCSNNASVAREALLRLGGYDEGFYGWGVDDVELTYRLMTAGVPLLMDSAPWVYHQEHPRSLDTQATASGSTMIRRRALPARIAAHRKAPGSTHRPSAEKASPPPSAWSASLIPNQTLCWTMACGMGADIHTSLLSTEGADPSPQL